MKTEIFKIFKKLYFLDEISFSSINIQSPSTFEIIMKSKSKKIGFKKKTNKSQTIDQIIKDLQEQYEEVSVFNVHINIFFAIIF